MPRVLRRAKRRSAGYTEWHVYQLQAGIEFAELGFGWQERFREAEAREGWEIMREKILADWIREQPGTRPWAWWRWDAPQPARRERVDGGVHPHDNKARTLKVASADSEYFWRVAYRLPFGLPSCYIPPFDNGLKTEMFEPEWSFLVRHKLLLPADSPEFITPTESNECQE
jgi:hypothetical protein